MGRLAQLDQRLLELIWMGLFLASLLTGIGIIIFIFPVRGISIENGLVALAFLMIAVIAALAYRRTQSRRRK